MSENDYLNSSVVMAVSLIWFLLTSVYFFRSCHKITFEAVEGCCSFSWGRGGFRDCRAGKVGTAGSWVSATYAKNLQGGAGSNLPGLGQGQTELPGDQRELVCCSSETGEMASNGNRDCVPGLVCKSRLRLQS